jgi:hypothetical protein
MRFAHGSRFKMFAADGRVHLGYESKYRWRND